MAIVASDETVADRTARPQMGRGLFLLKQAYEYALDLHRDVWDFAVEISGLQAAGLTRSDLRWLVCKGYVEHAVEVTMMGSDGRDFQSSGDLTFGEKTCFVLTDEGSRFASSVEPDPASAFEERDIDSRNSATEADLPADRKPRSEHAEVPTWDPSRHELRLAGGLVKVFKLPSQNQEAILMAFEEEGWPPRIDDPLPPHPDLDPKRRLHDAIKGLNRNQKSRELRFMGDGTGEGIRWEVGLSPAENGNRPR